MKRINKLKKVFQRINFQFTGFPVDILKAQNIIYLLQRKGIKFNYTFEMTSTGIYSKGLTKDLKGLIDG